MDNLLPSYEAIMQTLELFNIQRITLEEFRNRFSLPWQEFFKGFGVSEIDLQTKKREHMERVIEMRKKSKPYISARRTMTWLHRNNLKIAIISDDLKEEILHTAIKHGLATYINEILTSQDYEPKPSPEMIEAAMGIFNAQKEETIFVGDTEQDIIAGKRAGVITVAYTGGWHSERRLKKQCPKYSIDDLSRLRDIIQKNKFTV